MNYAIVHTDAVWQPDRFVFVDSNNFMRRVVWKKCYTVAETVKLTGVKSYVLRYWEDELSLPIRRNELGHRCYTQDDIQLFLNIKELKKRGLQLRAIHDLLQSLHKKEGMEVIVPEEKRIKNTFTGI